MVILMFSSVIHFFHPRPPAKKREKKTLTRSLTIMMLWVCCWILCMRMTSFFFCVLILSIYLTLDQFQCVMLCRGKPPDMERILSSSLHSAAEIYMMCGSAQRPSINPMIPPPLGSVMRLNEIKHPSRCQVTLSAPSLHSSRRWPCSQQMCQAWGDLSPKVTSRSSSFLL